MIKLFSITLCLFLLNSEVFGQKLKKVIPHHVKTQFAGGIGFLSIGAGYENKIESLEGDIYYGYLPKNIGGVSIHSATAKLTWLPFKTIDLNWLQYNFLSTGILANYKFGEQYFLFDPDYYPYSYYGHPTALHIGFFIGGQLKKPVADRNIKQIALYYELGTTDRELISLLTNKSLKANEILNLALGVKTSF